MVGFGSFRTAEHEHNPLSISSLAKSRLSDLLAREGAAWSSSILYKLHSVGSMTSLKRNESVASPRSSKEGLLAQHPCKLGQGLCKTGFKSQRHSGHRRYLVNLLDTMQENKRYARFFLDHKQLPISLANILPHQPEPTLKSREMGPMRWLLLLRRQALRMPPAKNYHSGQNPC